MLFQSHFLGHTRAHLKNLPSPGPRSIAPSDVVGSEVPSHVFQYGGLGHPLSIRRGEPGDFSPTPRSARASRARLGPVFEMSSRLTRVALSVGILIVLLTGAHAQGQPGSEGEAVPADTTPSSDEAPDSSPEGAAQPALGADAALPAESPLEPPESISTVATRSYKKGFVLKSDDGNYSLKIGGRIQTRFELEIPETGEEEAAFAVNRAKLGLSGHALSEAIRYKFQADFGKGKVVLNDFYVDYHVAKPVWLRVGQYKTAFTRQWLTSSGKQEFVDRSITHKAFGAGRGIGISVHNRIEKSPQIEWAVGLYNGTGEKAGISVDTEDDGDVSASFGDNVPGRLNPTIVARLGYNSPGMKGYSEADFEGGPFRFAVGASGRVEFDADKGKFASDDGDDSSIAGALDFAFKVNGVSGNVALYLASEQDGSGFGDQRISAVGGRLQAGYLIGGKYQPAIRYAQVNPDGADNTQHEFLGGFSVYFHKHKFKWQTDAGALVEKQPVDGQVDFVARSQLQLAF